MKTQVLSSIASLFLLLPDPVGAQPAPAGANSELKRRYGLRTPAPQIPPTPAEFVSSADRLGQLAAADAGPKLDFEFTSIPLAAVMKEVQEAFLKRTKFHLSVVVPEAHSEFFNNTSVSIKVRQVTVGQFFELLEKASLHPLPPLETAGGVDPTTGLPLPPPPPRFIGYGFRLVNIDQENPIWMFYNDLPANGAAPVTSQPAMCRFFNLAPFLDDLKVEDITTVIRAGWEMLGNPNAAKFMFHKETRMLVVVGPERELSLIDQVLQELRTGRVTSRSEPPATGVAPAPRTK